MHKAYVMFFLIYKTLVRKTFKIKILNAIQMDTTTLHAEFQFLCLTVVTVWFHGFIIYDSPHQAFRKAIIGCKNEPIL